MDLQHDHLLYTGVGWLSKGEFSRVLVSSKNKKTL